MTGPRDLSAEWAAAIEWDSRFWSKVHPEALSGCWLWHGPVNRGGYGHFSMGSRADRSRRTVIAHRHAYELTRGPIQTGMVVRHKCDVPACVNPDHLEIGTVADNNRDRVNRRRSAPQRGEANNQAKLSEAQVRDMLVKHAAGDRTQQSIATEFGVSPQHVSRIIRGERWSHKLGGEL